MFGTIMRARTKPGQRDAFIELMKSRARPGNNPGFHSAEVCAEDKDANGVMAVIHFHDRAGYLANADRPETDAEYRKMLDYLEGPPEWIDVEYRHFAGEPLSESSVAATR